MSTAVLQRKVKDISSAIKLKYFLLRTRATSGAGPMLRMMCPTTGKSAEQARGTRATPSGGFHVRVFARGRRRSTGGAGTTTKTPPAGTTVHLPGRSLHQLTSSNLKRDNKVRPVQYTMHGHACLGLCDQHGENYWWCPKSRRLPHTFHCPLSHLSPSMWAHPFHFHATTCLSLGGQVQTARLRTSGGIIAHPASTAPGSSFHTSW